MPTPIGTNAFSLKIDPRGHFLYATASGSNGKFYSIDPATGKLSLAGSIIGSGFYRAMAFSPNGRFAYIANSGNGSVSTMGANLTTGALSFLGDMSSGAGPRQLVLSSDGRFLYSADDNTPGKVYAFQIDQSTGLPVSIGNALVGNNPNGLAVDPSVHYLYVSNSSSSSVSDFSIDPVSGAITSIGTITTTALPQGMFFHPSLPILFVGHGSSPGGSITLFQFSANSGGIGSIGEFSAGNGATRLMMEPSGDFVYSTDFKGNVVNAFQFNPSGTLTPLGAPIATGTGPVAIEIE